MISKCAANSSWWITSASSTETRHSPRFLPGLLSRDTSRYSLDGLRTPSSNSRDARGDRLGRPNIAVSFPDIGGDDDFISVTCLEPSCYYSCNSRSESLISGALRRAASKEDRAENADLGVVEPRDRTGAGCDAGPAWPGLDGRGTFNEWLIVTPAVGDKYFQIFVSSVIELL